VTFRPKPGTFFEPRVAVYEQVEDQPFFYVRQVGVLNKLDSARLNRAQALARNFEPVLAAEEQAPFALDDAGARLGRKLGLNASSQIRINRLSADVHTFLLPHR
jgi:hypothetical protein